MISEISVTSRYLRPSFQKMTTTKATIETTRDTNATVSSINVSHKASSSIINATTSNLILDVHNKTINEAIMDKSTNTTTNTANVKANPTNNSETNLNQNLKATFISKINQFELLLEKVNSKANETSASTIGTESSTEQAGHVKFKTHWELLTIYLSSCFVCGFESIDLKEKFELEFMNFILNAQNAFFREGSRSSQIRSNSDQNDLHSQSAYRKSNLKKNDKNGQKNEQRGDEYEESNQQSQQKKSNQNDEYENIEDALKIIRDKHRKGQFENGKKEFKNFEHSNKFSKDKKYEEANKRKAIHTKKVNRKNDREVDKDVDNTEAIGNKIDSIKYEEDTSNDDKVLSKDFTGKVFDRKQLENKESCKENLVQQDGKQNDLQRIAQKSSQNILLNVRQNSQDEESKKIDSLNEKLLKNQTNSNKKQNEENKKDTNSSLLEQLIHHVYQATGIQAQIQSQIELIKLDLLEKILSSSIEPTGNKKTEADLKESPQLNEDQDYRKNESQKIENQNTQNLSVKLNFENRNSKDSNSQNNDPKYLDRNQKSHLEKNRQREKQNKEIENENERIEPKTAILWEDNKKSENNLKMKQRPKDEAILGELNSSDVHSSNDVNQLTYQWFDLNKAYLIKIDKSLTILTDNKSKGRGIYSTREINSESIDENTMNRNLIIERPFITWLNPSYYQKYCENCFKLIKLRFECEECKTINYCSKECYEECLAISINHSIECDHINILSKFGLFQMACRILFKECSLSQNYRRESQSAKSNEMKNKSSKVCESSLNSKSSEKFESTRKSKKTLSRNARQDSSKEQNLIRNYSKNSSILELQSLINFYSLAGPVESNPFVRLLQIALILKQNTMEVYDEINGQSIGHALYLTTSLLNHACKPNCTRSFNGNQVMVFRDKEKSIKANSELTISYGLSSNLSAKDRREELKQRFGFDCLCADCCEENDCQKKSNNCSQYEDS